MFDFVVQLSAKLMTNLLKYQADRQLQRSVRKHTMGHDCSTSALQVFGWGQKRSWTSSACSVDTTAGVVVFRSNQPQGARYNTPSDPRLHHPCRPKLTNMQSH